MTDAIPQGRFFLRPGIRLIHGKNGGVLLQSAPLRALRLNAAAFEILTRCQTGFHPAECTSAGAGLPRESVFPFLDSLWQAGFLDWRPAAGAFEPCVSIVIPVYNRASEIGACLEALLALNYPPDKREIIVVDDGSTDETPAVVRNYRVKLIELFQNRGQSAARNVGAAAATGEIIAFIDSDCIADPDWLHELLPYFQDIRVALAGGYVDSFYQESWLDRYEEVQSPLNMGKEGAFGTSAASDFYVPTCNVLIRKNAYMKAGGLDEGLRLGEDVDLCWRLKGKGHRLLYVPRGRVRHKHRNRFWDIFTRRFDYGTSEAFLFTRHKQVRKKFPWKPAALGFLGLLCLCLLTGSPLLLPLAGLIWIGSSWHSKIQMQKKIGVLLRFRDLLGATLKEYLACAFYLSYHFVRYYLLLMIILALSFPGVAALLGTLILFPVTIEYLRKVPRLVFPLYLFFFLMEQAFYQMGVFWGCVKTRSYKPYHLVFTIPRQSTGSNRTGRPARFREKKPLLPDLSGTS